MTRAAKGTDESAPRFFDSPAHFREWLRANHSTVPPLWIGFWKVHTGRGGLTYLEAVEEALCFGWIDGLKKRFDERAFVQRFTPRRAKLYSFERDEPAQLDAASAKRFRPHRDAWRFFQAQPAGYQRVALHWIMGAKKAETRAKRLDHLIAESAKALRLPALAGGRPNADRDSPPPRRAR